MSGLVLSRKAEQSVVIGDRDIVVKVLSVRGGKVRLRFEAATGVPIHREEVYQRIQAAGGEDR